MGKYSCVGPSVCPKLRIAVKPSIKVVCATCLGRHATQIYIHMPCCAEAALIPHELSSAGERTTVNYLFLTCVYVCSLLIRPRKRIYTPIGRRLTLHTSARELHEAIAASQVHMPRPSEAPELKALPCPEPVPNPCIAEVHQIHVSPRCTPRFCFMPVSRHGKELCIGQKCTNTICLRGLL